MSSDLESRLPNADMRAAPHALLRTARRAREIARETNTAIVIVSDGVLVKEREETLETENRNEPIRDGK